MKRLNTNTSASAYSKFGCFVIGPRVAAAEAFERVKKIQREEPTTSSSAEDDSDEDYVVNNVDKHNPNKLKFSKRKKRDKIKRSLSPPSTNTTRGRRETVEDLFEEIFNNNKEESSGIQRETSGKQEKEKEENWSGGMKRRNTISEPAQQISSTSSSVDSMEEDNCGQKRYHGQQGTPRKRGPKPRVKSESKECKERIYLPIPEHIKSAIQLMLCIRHGFKGLQWELVEHEFRHVYPSLRGFKPSEYGYDGFEEMLRSAELKTYCYAATPHTLKTVRGHELKPHQGRLHYNSDTGVFTVAMIGGYDIHDEDSKASLKCQLQSQQQIQKPVPEPTTAQSKDIVAPPAAEPMTAEKKPSAELEKNTVPQPTIQLNLTLTTPQTASRTTGSTTTPKYSSNGERPPSNKDSLSGSKFAQTTKPEVVPITHDPNEKILEHQKAAEDILRNPELQEVVDQVYHTIMKNKKTDQTPSNETPGVNHPGCSNQQNIVAPNDDFAQFYHHREKVFYRREEVPETYTQTQLQTLQNQSDNPGSIDYAKYKGPSVLDEKGRADNTADSTHCTGSGRPGPRTGDGWNRFRSRPPLLPTPKRSRWSDRPRSRYIPRGGYNNQSNYWSPGRSRSSEDRFRSNKNTEIQNMAFSVAVLQHSKFIADIMSKAGHDAMEPNNHDPRLNREGRTHHPDEPRNK